MSLKLLAIKTVTTLLHTYITLNIRNNFKMYWKYALTFQFLMNVSIISLSPLDIGTNQIVTAEVCSFVNKSNRITSVIVSTAINSFYLIFILLTLSCDIITKNWLHECGLINSEHPQIILHSEFSVIV